MTPEPRGTSITLETLGRLGRDRVAMLGVVMVGTVLLAAVMSPFVSPYNFDAIHGEDRLLPPGWRYLLGTDELGRDLLTRTLWGARVSLPISLAAVALACLTGVTVGMLAGYYRGWFGHVAMRAIDIVLALPGLVLALTLVAVLGPGLRNLVIALAIGWVPIFARVARGMALSVAAEPYTESARAIGAGDVRIMTRYLLPNAMAPIIITATSSISGLILAEAGLSFLGVGIQPPTPSWGTMISAGKAYLEVSPWLMVWPGLAIFVAVLGFSLLGDGIRDATDPRLRGL